MTIKVRITREENAAYYGVSVGDTVEVNLIDYVAAVVASEIGNARIEAAKAQAIAARTFAYPYYSKGLTITDSSSTHQAFRTSRLTSAYANARQAAIDTDGLVLTYNGTVINSCPYSNSNGGRTTSSQQRWGGYRAWLIEQDDPWDRAAGGNGNGHGVGMSQVGCHYAAKIGKTCEEILAFYYPGTVITNMSIKERSDTMNDKAMKVVQAAESAMGWPYVYGAWGSLCTPSVRKQYIGYHSDHEAAICKNCQVLNGTKSSCSGCKWDGARCFDCRGFTYWCLKEAGIVISGAGATSQYNTTSNWIAQGNISDMPNVVCCLFKYKDGKMSHTGLHVGDGKIIHCSVNVQTGKTTDSGWTHYAIPIGLYSQDELASAGKVTIMPTVKKNSKGEAVRLLQEKLTELKYLDDKIDGVFGAKTETAVKLFQAEHNITVDGVCGTMTWKTLLEVSLENKDENNCDIKDEEQSTEGTGTEIREEKHELTLEELRELVIELQKQVQELLKLHNIER